MRKDIIPAAQAINFVRKNDELDLIQLLGTLWRGKWMILLFVGLAVLAGVIYAFFIAVPKYTSSTVVALESRESQVVDFESVVSGLSADQATVNTEVEVLRARILIGKLADQLKLMADPEFNARLRSPSTLSLGGLMQTLGLANQRNGEPSEKATRDAVIDSILQNVAVSNMRNSYVFRISATTEDPLKSALIADTLAELYINDQLVTKFQATEQATTWLTERVSELKIELEAAETAVKEYNTATELIGPETLAAQNRQLKDFRARLNDSQRTITELNAQIDAMKSAYAEGNLQAMAAASGDQTLLDAVGGAGQNAGAQAIFEARFGQQLERLRVARDREQVQINVLKASIADKQADVEAQSADLVQLQQLEREAAASGLIYEYFLSRLKETSVQQGIQQADARILSYAVVAERPSHPRKSTLLGTYSILGFLFGAIAVTVREMRQTGFRTAEDLEQATGVTVIGQIPRGPVTRRDKVLDYILSKPTSAMVEAVRNLRTTILLSNIDNPPQIIMLTSSVSGEGKTTQALALAKNMSGLGKKVLVIEGDIRRRTFREYFETGDRPGLLSAVSGDANVKDIVWTSEQLGVDILLGEDSAINAADFFSSDKFAQFLKSQRKSYDVILIDTPPVLVVPDARVIALLADVVVYVVHWDKTPQVQVEQGLHAFSTINVPVTGLVLSQIDPKGARRYGDAYAAHGSNYYSD